MRNPGLIAVVILVLGLGGALWIYVAAALGPGDVSGEDPTDSKQYQRQMELYGGKANVLAADLMRWLGSLGHGRRLAVTVTCAAVVVAGGVWLLADPPPASGAARPSRDGR